VRQDDPGTGSRLDDPGSNKGTKREGSNAKHKAILTLASCGALGIVTEPEHTEKATTDRW